jgi:serine/threonine protein kinase
MEFCNGGGLSSCLEEYKKKNRKPFPEEVVQYLMKQIVSGINYLHKRHILHRDIKLDNILVNFENDEDKRNKNMLKAKVKIIDFGFARHLNPSQLAFSTLGSPINMDPGILRKLNKMENSRDYGYDEKADIWSLGTICYEMLIGKCTFDAESMKELVYKVEKGNYFLPTNLSKEAVSFLNGMLQYDSKKRLNSEQLMNHAFLTKSYSELKKMNLKDVSKNIIGNQLQINSKKNMSIWVILENENENEDLDNISPEIYQEKNNIQNGGKLNNYIQNNQIVQPQKIIKNIVEEKKKTLDEQSLKQEFLNAFDQMNDDLIYTEPQLIPIILGDDPNVMSKITEFNEDNF